MRHPIAIASAAMAMVVGANQAHAESKGYIISNWAPAMNNFDDSGCPEGKNPGNAEIVAFHLKQQGMPEAEVAKIVTPEGVKRDAVGDRVVMRGRKDGQPVNAYTHPLTAPDSNIKLEMNKEGFGFNLDGKVGPMDYFDPLTKEAGVDNAAARVFGCYDRTRGTLEAPPGNWSYRWAHYMEGASWHLSVDNHADRPLDFKNEEKVTITFYRSQQKPMMNSSGYQRDVTYTIDPNAELQTLTTFKGSIKNGMFMSERTPQFRMIASSRIQPVFDFKSALMRMEFNEDGSLRGFVGGYLPIKMIYFPFGDYASSAESAGGMDVPATYQALQRNADSDIDMVGNIRTRISQTYQLSAVPAYLIEEAAQTQTARAK